MKAILVVALLANGSFLTGPQKAEVRRVEGRLLAPCCYTQSIAEHGSEIARQMRREVAQKVAEGRTEEEVISYYKALYGDRILIVPHGITGTILFSLPLVTSVLASVVLAVFLRKMLRSGKDNLSIATNRESLSVTALHKRIEEETGEPF
jgi:cytochrome c-type biogenesis protein CcmH